MQIIFVNLPWLILFLILLLILTAKPLIRYIVKQIINLILTKLLAEQYTKNVAEMLPSITRFSVLNLLELSLRGQEGKVIGRPIGSPKKIAGLDLLTFQPRQMTSLALPANAKIDLSTTIGTRAAKPLTLKIPLLIGGMAYGLALSEEAKVALAKAASRLGTATNSGEGPFLPEEASAADKFILQIARWPWGLRTNEQIATSDMLEVQMGQGADAGTSCIDAKEIKGRAQKLSGLSPGQQAVAHPLPPGMTSHDDWPQFINQLRSRANGIPIALKLMATNHLEEDLAIAVNLGFDAVVIDGCQGGSHATAPIKQDDFGIPSLYALVRAKRCLEGTAISLIVSGGYFTPGQCLKALALGADAIALGTVPLFALGNNQLQKVLPWGPPTTLIYYESPDKNKLDIEMASTSIVNVFTSMTLEMEEAMRALGKQSLTELGPDDLAALDDLTAQLTGVQSACKQLPGPQRQSLNKLYALLQIARQLAAMMEQTAEQLRQRS